MRICNGDVCIEEMRELDSKKVQMKKLCSSATVDGKEQFGLPSTDNVDKNLEMRLKEYEQFAEYHQQLTNLMSFLKSLKLQGTSKYIGNTRSV